MKIKKILAVALCLITLVTALVVPMAADEPAATSASLLEDEPVTFGENVFLLNADYGTGHDYYEALLNEAYFGVDMNVHDYDFYPELNGTGKKRCIDASNVVVCFVTTDGRAFCISCPRVYVYYEVIDGSPNKITWELYDKGADAYSVWATFADEEVTFEGSVWYWNPFVQLQNLVGRDGEMVFSGATTKPSLGVVSNVEKISVLFMGKSSVQDMSFNRCFNNCGFKLSEGRSYRDGYTDAEESAYDEGYWDGYDIGYSDGKINGIDIGYLDGYDVGYNDGHGEGHALGYASGMAQGKSECERINHESIWDRAETEGFEAGYERGAAEEGSKQWSAGWELGYGQGASDAVEGTETVRKTIFAIFEAPGRFIDGVFDFDVLGINVASFVKTLITLLIIAAVVTILIKFIL